MSAIDRHQSNLSQSRTSPSQIAYTLQRDDAVFYGLDRSYPLHQQKSGAIDTKLVIDEIAHLYKRHFRQRFRGHGKCD